MDIDERSPKRRRTSSTPSSSRDISEDRTPNHSLPLRRADTDRLRGAGRYAAPSSRDGSYDRAAARSPISNSSRSTSRSQSRSYTPPPASKQKHLSFTPLHTILKAHARGITCLKFSPDGSLLATSSADATINIYSVPSSLQTRDQDAEVTFKHLKTLQGHLSGINALAWSPRGPPYTLASASDDKSILLWQPLTSDQPIAPSPLLGHHNYVYSLAFSPKGNMLVSGSYDEAVFLWDVRAGRVMRSLPAHSDPVGGVDFLPGDGSMVVSCAGDGLIRIWDAGTGQCLRTLVDEDRKGVTTVRFSPNGRFVVAWTLDGCVRLWRYVEGKGACVKTYQGHVNREYSLSGTMGSYGVDGGSAFVVSGSEDGEVVVWDVSTKEVMWRGQGHTQPVLGVDFVRVGGKGVLASGGLDRDIRAWVEDVDVDESSGNERGRGRDGFKREDTEDLVTEQLIHGMETEDAEVDAVEEDAGEDDE